MITREEISAEITKKVKYKVYTCPDLGAYCLLFKTACRCLSKIKFTPTEHQLIWYVLGNMREDGQVYLNKRQLEKELDVSYNSIKDAIEGLRVRTILLPLDYGTSNSTGYYKLGDLTSLVNPHIVFQGKLTSTKAKFINEQFPDIWPLRRLSTGKYVDPSTGEYIQCLGDKAADSVIDIRSFENMEDLD